MVTMEGYLCIQIEQLGGEVVNTAIADSRLSPVAHRQSLVASRQSPVGYRLSFLGLTYEVDNAVDFDRLTLAVPPFRLTYVTRAEHHLCAVWQRHLDLNDGVLSTRCADESFD